MRTLNQQKKEGFTLVELLVSVSLFAVIATTAISSLTTINAVAKRSQAARSAMDNVNYALENMSRKIKVGRNYNCGDLNDFGLGTGTGECPSGSGKPQFGFLESDGTIHAEYRIKNITLADASVRGQIEFASCAGAGCTLSASSWTPLTSTQNINIKRLAFFVQGSTARDGLQPEVLILINGTATIPKGNGTSESVDFNLQTKLTQRLLEN